MAGTIYRDARGRFMWSGKPQHSVAAAAGCAGTSCHGLASMFDVGRHASRVVRPPGTGDALAAMCDAAIAEPWMVPVPCSVGGAALLRRLMSARARAPRPESACTGGLGYGGEPGQLWRRAPAPGPGVPTRLDVRLPHQDALPMLLWIALAITRKGRPYGIARAVGRRAFGVLGYRGEPGQLWRRAPAPGPDVPTRPDVRLPHQTAVSHGSPDNPTPGPTSGARARMPAGAALPRGAGTGQAAPAVLPPRSIHPRRRPRVRQPRRRTHAW